MTERRPKPDWSSIERQYRSNPRSIKEIARTSAVSDTAIRKRAAAYGWSRPSGAPSSRELPSSIIGRGRSLTLRMLDELEAVTCMAGDLEALIGASLDADDEKRREAMAQAVSLKSRADVLRTLALAAKTLAEASAATGKKAERQAAAEERAAGKFAPVAPPRGHDGRH